MITTHEADKAGPFFAEPGVTAWRSATLELGMLYVFINYGLKEETGWVYQTSIVWDSRDVLEFCRGIKNNPSAKIVDISLLEPSRRGRIQTWRWTKVLQIRLWDEDSVEHPVYFTDAGEAVGLTPEEAKKKMKLIYKSRQT
jgi:hypothetical protein